MKKRGFILFPIFFLIFIGLLGNHSQARRDNVFVELEKSMELLTSVLDKVMENYVEEPVPAELIESALKGMVSSLDPHSQFLVPDEYKDLMVGTRGEFGGLGIEIAIKDNVLTVISPIVGTPAYRIGIQAGDRIIKIEGEPTEGITTHGAVKKLRGKPGTQVTITISREGEEEPIDYTITREIIKIDNVPYYDIIDTDIGYIKLVTFSRNAGRNVRKAVEDLENRGAKKILLDLRWNAGGLLSEAVDVADEFISKDKMIVYQRGRIKDANEEFKARRNSKYGEYPLIILVNEGSASASEIVSGAVQDWDRGLIVGTNTFGKGSVQRIYPLRGGYAIKLTTAKYHAPSGRSIHKDELSAEEDTLKEMIFHTLGRMHRDVKGSGGITPDIIVEEEKLKGFKTELWRKRVFFDFAVKYTAYHKDIKRSFEVDDDILKDFKKLLDEKKIEYTDEDFSSSMDFIKRRLRGQILANVFGKKELYAATLEGDPVVERAIELLSKVSDTEGLFSLLKD